MSVTRKVCIEYVNEKGELKQFFQNEIVGIFVDGEISVGRLDAIWVDYLTLDCSINFGSEIKNIALKDIDEVLSYDDYKDIQPLR